MKNIKDLTCKEAEKELNKIRNKYENFIEDCTQDDFTYAELLVRYINSYSYKENRAVAYSKFTDYKNNIEKHRKLTPIVQNLKLNYILKDDLSL